MRIQYASDLHLEFQENRAWLFEHGIKPAADILVLAGDIARFGDLGLFKDMYFDYLANNWEQVYMVPGNHEYYRGIDVMRTLTDCELKVRYNVRYLNNRSVVHGDTEIFFTTLWSKVPDEFIPDIQDSMMDTRRIVYNGDQLTAQDYNELHGICAGWLKRTIEASAARHKVVVTHHCPTRNEAFNGYPGSRLSHAFMVDEDDFIREHPDIDCWVFGHTHYNGDEIVAGKGMIIGKTRLVTNQLGYTQYYEQKGFDPSAVIVLGDVEEARKRLLNQKPLCDEPLSMDEIIAEIKDYRKNK